MHHFLRLIVLVLIALLLRLVPPQEVDFLVLLADEEHVRGAEREGKSDDDGCGGGDLAALSNLRV